MASYKKFLLPSAPLSLQPPPTLTTTTKGESMDHPLIVHIPLLPMQLHNKGERNVVGGCKKAVALKIRGPESPWSPHQRLPKWSFWKQGNGACFWILGVLGGKGPPSSGAVYHHLYVPVKDMASFEMPQELVLVLSLRTHSSAPIVPISMVERRSCKGTLFCPHQM